MRSAESWFAEYSTTHQNPRNQKIHMFAVPAIFWTVIAMVCGLPPLFMLLLLPPLTFYFRLGMRYGLTMTMVTFLCMLTAFAIRILGLPLHVIALIIFVIAWVAQFYGHKIEGKKPSFFTDLLFLFIGPLWILRKLRLLPESTTP